VTIQFGKRRGDRAARDPVRGVSTLKNANTSIDKAILRYSETAAGRSPTSRRATSTVEQAGAAAGAGELHREPGGRRCRRRRWQFDLLGSQNGFPRVLIL
jgi:hypothetical protein